MSTLIRYAPMLGSNVPHWLIIATGYLAVAGLFWS